MQPVAVTTAVPPFWVSGCSQEMLPVFHDLYWSRSCLRGSWSVRTSPGDLQARAGLGTQIIDPTGAESFSFTPSVESMCPAGVDLLSLDGRLAVRCCNTSLPHREVKRFLRLGRWVYKVHSALGVGHCSWPNFELFSGCHTVCKQVAL